MMLITRRRPTAVTKLPITVLLLITLAALITVSTATARDNVSAALVAAAAAANNAQQPLLQQQPQEQLHDDSSNTTTTAAAQCLYELVVKTAAVEGAGTDARISLTLSSADGSSDSVLEVEDLESWGWLGSDYDYFEPGDLDIFGAGHACLATMPCRMLLVSDGSSGKPNWYPSMVEIIQITTELSVSVRKFFPDQWLSAERPPYRLFVYMDLCAANDTAAVAA